MAKAPTKTPAAKPRTRATKAPPPPLLPGNRKLMISRALLGLIILLIMAGIASPSLINTIGDQIGSDSGSGGTHGGVTNGSANLATFFTPEVMYWRNNILRWGQERNLNPNLIATIMQIESCGDPFIASHAGAQGLFQVMPLHFDDGENQLDLENNARNGMDHLLECLQLSDYDVGVSFACYNGGASVIYMPQSDWYEETRSYYRWGSGIYGDAARGAERSDTLDAWLAAGGSGLCERAHSTQQFYSPLQ